MSVDQDGLFAAVDLGAASGRVMVARIGPGRVELTEVHRFTNQPVSVNDTLHWDIRALYQSVLDGLRAATELVGRLDGIGVDSWAVDYGLLDGAGVLLGHPVHYRDRRTESAVDRVFERIPASRLYAATGIQHQRFNTIFQLAAESPEVMARAERVLLIPDLISYWLTGHSGTERTNASTTGLLDTSSGHWSTEVMDSVGIDANLFAPLHSPGDLIGRLRPEIAKKIGLSTKVAVYAVGSHDTASAVVAVPASDEYFAYVSSGTWSLVGVELPRPARTEASRKANFTNELGVDGRIRFLRNVMGLWLLQECQRDLGIVDPHALLASAAAVPGPCGVIDATDPRFLAPGDMPARIAAACREVGQPIPAGPAEVTRCVLDSLALAHRQAVVDATGLSGQRVDVVHMVGGGVRNELLCQLTADACGLPVLAGPVEATALGNALVQARAAGVIDGDLSELRALIRDSTPLRTYQPR